MAQFVGHRTKLVVPLLPKSAHKWVFEKLIEGEAQCLPLFSSTAADAPLVIVQGYGAVAESFFADRVEGAANGFDKGMDG